MSHIKVEKADLIIVCVSKPYLESRNCKKELEYADELNKNIILVKLDKELDLKGHGAYSMILSKQLYVSNWSLPIFSIF